MENDCSLCQWLDKNSQNNNESAMSCHLKNDKPLKPHCWVKRPVKRPCINYLYLKSFCGQANYQDSGGKLSFNIYGTKVDSRLRRADTFIILQKNSKWYLFAVKCSKFNLKFYDVINGTEPDVTKQGVGIACDSVCYMTLNLMIDLRLTVNVFISGHSTPQPHPVLNNVQSVMRILEIWFGGCHQEFPYKFLLGSF